MRRSNRPVLSAMVHLVAPNTRYRPSFLRAIEEFAAEGRSESTYAPALGYGDTRLRQHFDCFVCDLLDLRSGKLRGTRRSPDYVLWLVDGKVFVGQVSVRPELTTDFLITYGGHIGYSIRPSLRQRGYGRQILALALPVARSLGLLRVLVTCNADNHASRRIIERNGGRFERALPMPRQTLVLEGRDPDTPVDKLRFWIDLEGVPCESPGLSGHNAS